MVNMMENSIAFSNPLTLNPGTMALARSIIRPLMTKVNSPSVRILIGSVSISNKGLMMTLTKPRTIAASKAPTMPTLAPGNTKAVMPMARADMIQVVNVVMV